MTAWRTTPLRIALVLGLALSAVRFVGCPTLHRLDSRAVDLRLIERGTQETSDRVVIVAIDDASLARIGRWPWSRAVLARLVSAIDDGEPSVIGLDIVNAEPSSAVSVDALRPHVEGVDERTWTALRDAVAKSNVEDGALASAIAESGRVVLGYFFDFEDPEPDARPLPVSGYDVVSGDGRGRSERYLPAAVDAVANLDALTAAAAGTGYFNVFPDAGDGVYRRVPMVIRYADEYALPLAAAMLARHAAGSPTVLRLAPFGVAGLKLAGTAVPVAEDGQLLLNYRGPHATFTTVPAHEVLDGSYDVAELRDALVLVGVTASAVADVRSTPFDGVFPGVEMHATVLDNVLRGDFLLQPRWMVLVEITVMLVAAIVLGLVLERARGIAAAVTAVALLGGYLFGTQWLFESSGLALGIIYPVLAISLTYSAIALRHYLAEAGEKREWRSRFGLYVGPDLARLVGERPELRQLGGEKRRLTVMFSDIRGFTSISERIAPETLVELLNVYLGDMTQVVFDREGTLDKYIGDAIMAFWGAPIPHSDHSARACAAALDMVAHLNDLNAVFDAQGWPRIEAGIGLHTGEMVVGNMGSMQRFSYTVIGDNVNIASRLEGLTKHYRTQIVASEDTVADALDTVVARELDIVRVKGKAQPIRLYDVLGSKAENGRWQELVSEFSTSVSLYRDARWQEALARFERLQQSFPSDGPTQLYVERCRALLDEPPPPGWEPITVMETK